MFSVSLPLFLSPPPSFSLSPPLSSSLFPFLPSPSLFRLSLPVSLYLSLFFASLSLSLFFSFRSTFIYPPPFYFPFNLYGCSTIQHKYKFHSWVFASLITRLCGPSKKIFNFFSNHKSYENYLDNRVANTKKRLHTYK